MSYLAIDWGKKRIGLAIGTIFPKGAGFVDGEQSAEKIIDEIKKKIAENEVEKIIVGLPMLASGDEGKIAEEIRSFSIKLGDATGIEIVFEPEEFTSLEAAEQFEEHGKKFRRASGKLDEMAAILILEQYLNHIKDQVNF